MVCSKALPDNNAIVFYVQVLQRLVTDPSEDIVYLRSYASYVDVANFLLNQPVGKLATLELDFIHLRHISVDTDIIFLNEATWRFIPFSLNTAICTWRFIPLSLNVNTAICIWRFIPFNLS